MVHEIQRGAAAGRSGSVGRRQVLWVYGLHSNDPDEYVKKPMNQCSGEEILKEMLYWFGAGQRLDRTFRPASDQAVRTA